MDAPGTGLSHLLVGSGVVGPSSPREEVRRTESCGAVRHGHMHSSCPLGVLDVSRGVACQATDMARCSTTGKQVALLALIALASSCGIIDGQACTAVGCIDGATIELRTSDGTQRTYEVTLLIDGREVTCATPALADATSFSTAECSEPRISIDHGPLVDCTETRSADAVSQSCQPNGKFAQTINLRETPARVVVTLTDASNATFQHSFDLQYVTSRPNGPDCEPTCHQADAEWVVQ
jgi:hypothetical protein